MKKSYKVIALLLVVITLFLCGCTKAENKPAEETTISQETEWNINSATWQDKNNLVLLWDSSNLETYKIYRMNDKNEYDLIGESSVGSYRDTTVKYPNEYTYKVEKLSVTSDKTIMSNPIVSGTNPQRVVNVPVIMYHNFITPKDEANGIEYEEYSIRPEDLEADLIWLEKNGYTTITSRELYTYLFEQPEKMPKKPIIISIDDGTWGVYTNAWKVFAKHNAKADLNVIGRGINNTWEYLQNGGTRKGDPAPYCNWEELKEMSDSGVINICSHTFHLHRYNRDGRIGMDIMEGESKEEYAKTVNKDYSRTKSNFNKFIGTNPTTVAYPYSQRHDFCDEIVLNNTGYKILMGGNKARGTEGNYFVIGCDWSQQAMIMSRPCRMDGDPISEYLKDVIAEEKSMPFAKTNLEKN